VKNESGVAPADPNGLLSLTARTAFHVFGQGAELCRQLNQRHLRVDFLCLLAYWNYSKNALDAGALDADLRAILRKEVSPWHVEIEAERVVTASRFASPSERGRFPS
jgi:hypothetical protein